jgi:replication-associated recombination protein RarA
MSNGNDTRHGLPAMACVSAMQKCIRRGLEREAMEFAVELMHTSKAFHSMICNRLEVICHEDLDTLAAPHVFPFVAASLAASRERYGKSIGEARLMVGNVIRMMARAPKSRAGCHHHAIEHAHQRHGLTLVRPRTTPAEHAAHRTGSARQRLAPRPHTDRSSVEAARLTEACKRKRM